MRQIYSAAAAALVTLAPQARADEPAAEQRGSSIGVSASAQQGCALLFGACTGERKTLAVRLGGPAARKEAVIAETRFDERTQGGFARVFPVTFRGRHYGAIDFALDGSQHLQGQFLSLTKSTPLGANGVLTLGGYVGQVRGTIAASAGLGATVDRSGERYAIGAGYSKDRSTQFGGLTEATLWSFALPQSQSALAFTQQLTAGIDRSSGSLGVGYVFAQNDCDRALLRNAGQEITLAGVPKGVVVTLHATANRVFFDPIGAKGDAKLRSYADTINARGQALTEPVGVNLPQVSAAQLGQLIGRESEPKTNNALQLLVVMPLGANSSLGASASRTNAGRATRGVAFNLQF